MLQIFNVALIAWYKTGSVIKWSSNLGCSRLGSALLARLAHQWPVCEPLASRGPNGPFGALAVSLFAAVSAERKLVHIAVQMLSADVVERAEQAALQQTVVALREIGMDDHGADELLIVVNRVVRPEIVV